MENFFVIVFSLFTLMAYTVNHNIQDIEANKGTKIPVSPNPSLSI